MCHSLKCHKKYGPNTTDMTVKCHQGPNVHICVSAYMSLVSPTPGNMICHGEAVGLEFINRPTGRCCDGHLLVSLSLRVLR